MHLAPLTGHWGNLSVGPHRVGASRRRKPLFIPYPYRLFHPNLPTNSAEEPLFLSRDETLVAAFAAVPRLRVCRRAVRQSIFFPCDRQQPRSKWSRAKPGRERSSRTFVSSRAPAQRHTGMPRNRFSALAFSALLVIAASGCASSPRPVLYPNAHYQTVGKATAEQDIAECMRLAEQSGVSDGKAGQAARGTAGAAAVGGAAGAAAGAVRGDVGRTAAAGAAAAGAARATRSLLNSAEPDSIYKSFVNKCLRDEGYEPLGWK